jgi:glycine cleavage system regulatory protein
MLPVHTLYKEARRFERGRKGYGKGAHMPTSLVLTVLGEDRPGLVEALSHIIAAHEGNWLESRMAHLAGQFAGILRASVPEGNATALLTALQGLAEHGLQVVVRALTRYWSGG